jgi:pimeloyl-ACP methyl ester carboxylesterase
MKKIYCISGLGADQRMFKQLLIPGYELVPVLWVPFDTDDSLASYARKMALAIPEKEPVMIGLSFGGMVAVEIAKYIPVKKVFLVSSAKTRAELGPVNGFIKWILRSCILPAWLFNIPNRFILDRFGACSTEELQLMKSIINDTDGHFMKWALAAMTAWENNITPDNLVHIHGTADKIIAPAHVAAQYWIEGGSHIMIYNRAKEVSAIIAGSM